MISYIVTLFVGILIGNLIDIKYILLVYILFHNNNNLYLLYIKYKNIYIDKIHSDSKLDNLKLILDYINISYITNYISKYFNKDNINNYNTISKNNKYQQNNKNIVKKNNNIIEYKNFFDI